MAASGQAIDPNRIGLGQEVFHDCSGPGAQEGSQKDFFGRQNQKKEILEHLRHGSHEPILVRGERRMGKTSMLRLIEAALKEGPDAERFIVPRRLHVAYFRDATTLVNEMAAILTTALGTEDYEPFPVGTTFSPQRAITAFRGMLKDVAGRTVVFILDELDEMLEAPDTLPEERRDILLLLRGFRAQRSVKFLCSFIRIPARLSREVDSFVCECKVIELPPLARDPFIEMVRELADPGLRLNKKDLDLIYRQSGGWPFFAKVILWYLVQEPAGARRLDRALSKVVEDRRDGRLAMAMNHIFEHHFDADEKMLVAMVSEDDNPTALSKLIRASSQNRDAPCWLPGAADRLIDRDYLQREGGGVVFRVGLLGPWFRSRNLRPPDSTANRRKAFRVALSYAHQQREFVTQVSEALKGRFDGYQILFDAWLTPRFAKADLDNQLPGLFRTQSEFIVVFWSKDYPGSDWTKHEWETIRSVYESQPERVMFVRLDQSEIGLTKVRVPAVSQGGASEVALSIIARYDSLKLVK